MTGTSGSTAPPGWFFLALVPVLGLGVWIMLQAYTSSAVRECQAGYRTARTAADTTRVDSLVPEGGADPHSCGFIRHSARWQ
jgi:hypothetical protein